MKGMLKRLAALVLILALCLTAFGRSAGALGGDLDEILSWYSLIAGESREDIAALIDEHGRYDDAVQVGMYLIAYGVLPENYITKAEARALGWPGGSLEPYAPGYAIGGDRFGNYEGTLPDDPDIAYTECDIGTMGARSRGPKRLVYDSEGRIYYTGDHYDTFTLLYEEGACDAQD